MKKQKAAVKVLIKLRYIFYAATFLITTVGTVLLPEIIRLIPGRSTILFIKGLLKLKGIVLIGR